MRGLLAVAVLGMTAWGCAVRGPEAGATETDGLAGSLEVEVVGDTARLTLHVTNAGGAPARLEFPSSQRYDFQVRTLEGAVLWTWSADKLFAQGIVVEELPAGGTLREREAWAVSAPEGEYVAVGRLTTNPPLELSARFRVPVR